jgi:acyl carrier protein
MERDAIFEVVRDLAAEKAEIDPGTITVETTQGDLGIDSIIMVDIMMDLEERLGIRMEDLKLPRNPSIGDIVGQIEANIGAAG